MSDEEKTTEEKSGGPGKMVLIMFLVNALAMLGAGAALFFVLQAKPAQAETEEMTEPKVTDNTKSEEEGSAEVDPKMVIPPDTPGPTMDLDTFVVNLDEAQGNRYVKMSLTLELVGEPARGYISGRMPRIRDALIAFLSSLSNEDVRGALGKKRVKEGVHERIAEIAPSMVQRVFITDFVIQ